MVVTASEKQRSHGLLAGHHPWLLSAGLGYAVLWYLRQNLWLRILAHGGGSAMHLLLLSYPLS